MAEVVEGIADGCRQSGCALLGGETAEMPGFYPQGRYDLAGFCVAVVEEDELIDGRRIQPGDSVIGVASSGVHSNGFSLVRKVLEKANADANTVYGDDQRPLIGDLLAPTTLYADLAQHLLQSGCEPRHGPHHRRRTPRKPAPLPAGRLLCAHRRLQLDEATPIPLATGGRRDSRTGPLAHVQPRHRLLPSGASRERSRCDRALPQQEPSGVGDWQCDLQGPRQRH